jgi:hypothetical protein
MNNDSQYEGKLVENEIKVGGKVLGLNCNEAMLSCKEFFSAKIKFLSFQLIRALLSLYLFSVY